MPFPKGVKRGGKAKPTARRKTISPTEKRMLEKTFELADDGAKPSDILKELLKQPRWQKHRPDQVMRCIKQFATLKESANTEDRRWNSPPLSGHTAEESEERFNAMVFADRERNQDFAKDDGANSPIDDQSSSLPSLSKAALKKRQFSQMSETDTTDDSNDDKPERNHLKKKRHPRGFADSEKDDDRRQLLKSVELTNDDESSKKQPFVFGVKKKTNHTWLKHQSEDNEESMHPRKKKTTAQRIGEGTAKHRKRMKQAELDRARKQGLVPPKKGRGRGADKKSARQFDFLQSRIRGDQKKNGQLRRQADQERLKRKAINDFINQQNRQGQGKTPGEPRASAFAGTGSAGKAANAANSGGEGASSSDFEVCLPNETLSMMGGISSLTETINTLKISIMHEELWRTLGTAPPRSILLHGPPGCGKSMFARCLAGECETALISVSAPELVSGMSGGSEAKIRALFDCALENAPCVVFMDEIDVIAAKREDASKAMEQRIVAQLLTSLDAVTKQALDKAVMFIAATNRPDSIDNALRRADRFDKELALGIPNEKERKEILLKICEPVKMASDVDYDELAMQTAGYVAADLKALVKEAGVTAAKRILDEKAQRDQSEENKDSDAKVTEMDVDSIDEGTKQENGRVKEHEYEHKDGNDELEQEDMDEFRGDFTDDIDDGSGYEFGSEIDFFSDPKIESKFGDGPSSSSNDIPHESDEFVGLDTTVCMNDLNDALPKVQPSARREGFATIPDVGWDDIGGASCQAVKAVMEREMIGRIRPETRELYRLLKVDASAGVLLYGPPGCGKTLIAKAVAKESGASFISIKGPELLNKYVGESERAIRTVFARARSSQPCVVFFDELDSIAPRRDGGGGGGGAGGSGAGSSGEGGTNVTQRIVNQLLTELDGVGERGDVFVIGATNRADIIDSALTRPGRLGRKIYIPLPSTVESRVSILRKHIGNKTEDGLPSEICSEELLKRVSEDDRVSRFSGADLAQLVKEASLNLIDECRTILINQYDQETKTAAKIDPELLRLEMRHFEKALETIRASVTKAEQTRYDLFHSILTEN